jgi:peptidoglycan/xylan/chitin deacetylase (PgdA/CDA1 family)
MFLSRRAFGAGAASLASGSSPLVEPALRLPPNDRPRVALTLDACPGAFDERLARVLVENEIPATIFVTALWIRSNPAGLAFLLSRRDLFSLQNHGARHVAPILGGRSVYHLRSAGSWDGLKGEILGGADAIQDACGVRPTWYRGAAAVYSADVLDPIRQLAFGIGGFSLNADMGASLPARTVADRIAAAADGDVIIGHINQPTRPSGAGIAAGVVALKRRGMGFVPLPPAGTMAV